MENNVHPPTNPPRKADGRDDLRQFWELGPEIFTIERFLESAEDCNDKIFTSAADRQVGPADGQKKHITVEKLFLGGDDPTFLWCN